VGISARVSLSPYQHSEVPVPIPAPTLLKHPKGCLTEAYARRALAESLKARGQAGIFCPTRSFLLPQEDWALTPLVLPRGQKNPPRLSLTAGDDARM